jgi:2Fe-2S ferredoxin
VKDLDGEIHEVKGIDGESLMEVLCDYEWGTPAVCGGLCACGSCQVYVNEEWLDKFPQAHSDEQDLLNTFGTAQENSRLSCQLIVTENHDGLEVTIAPED